MEQDSVSSPGHGKYPLPAAQYIPSPVAASGNSSQYPFLGPDNTYEKQRKCRMQDAIDDYLNDEKVSARRAYEEMLSCVQDVIDYHQKEYVKARELYDLLLGNRNPFPSE